MNSSFFQFCIIFVSILFGCYSWVYTRQFQIKNVFDKLRRLLFSLLVVHATSTNLGFIFLISGVPIDSNIIVTENYWHGPFILMGAVITGFWIQLTSEKKSIS
jgi:hypothetical protein